ncbi:MAG: MlaE family lipid ABC transporter permease subunit [Pseudomonadota bacterium]
MTGTPYFESDAKGEDASVLYLRGVWGVTTLAEIEDMLQRVLRPLQAVTFDGRNLDHFDTSAAWYIKDLRDRGFKITLKNFSKTQRQMCKLAEDLEDSHSDQAIEQRKQSSVSEMTAGFGQKMMTGLKNSGHIISLTGELVMSGAGILLARDKLRFRSVVFHINEIGYKALPVVMLMAFSIALVMGYQGATQLRNFGASIYTIDLVTISILREMGVLLTAIMVAGRTGSAFAAQLGTMQLNQEIDALRTMGVSPFNALILPRLMAIVIALPILTFIANIVGLFGIYVYAAYEMNITQAQFISRLGDVITPAHFWTGMIKAPVFAMIIGMIGCMQGLQVRNSAEDVGRHTTAAVVQSIFLVIIADALFSILYTKMGV